uniref:Uncharacterized protein n=1 Tax=Anguilla anguilla TaxID=7936 RepID=A0A0E9UZB6_ANGAN
MMQPSDTGCFLIINHRYYQHLFITGCLQ